MDVDFTPEDVAFREEVRSFIEENYPKNLGAQRHVQGRPTSVAQSFAHTRLGRTELAG